ncbi:hypothetical protein D9M68_973860 [compost metagenome]
MDRLRAKNMASPSIRPSSSANRVSSGPPAEASAGMWADLRATVIMRRAGTIRKLRFRSAGVKRKLLVA